MVDGEWGWLFGVGWGVSWGRFGVGETTEGDDERARDDGGEGDGVGEGESGMCTC